MLLSSHGNTCQDAHRPSHFLLLRLDETLKCTGMVLPDRVKVKSTEINHQKTKGTQVKSSPAQAAR